MFTQLFGGYLLNNQVLTAQQLSIAMESASNTRPKLGVLAINAGYLTSQQVDECHSLQASMDKRMGDIAVEKGYITAAQVEELLKSQKSGYLALGQAIIDNGFVSSAEFEKALNDYKKSSTITDSDLAGETEEKTDAVLNNYYDISSEDAFDGITDYIALLLKNIVRFIGDDFSLLAPEKTDKIECDKTAVQEICGSTNLYTAICADKSAFEAFANRYAQQQLAGNIEYINASVGEFLNLHNGLFTVNISQFKGVELDLMPQQITENGLEIQGSGYIVPVQFAFGIVRFVVICK